MKRKIAVLGLMLVSSVMVLPATGSANSPGGELAVRVEKNPQIRYRSRTWQTRQYQNRNRRWDNDRDRRRRSGRWYGYRNYGQWRRSQVGNRRYRMVTRYYWDGGRRRARLVRVYY
jgi:hypothetical protein